MGRSSQQPSKHGPPARTVSRKATGATEFESMHQQCETASMRCSSPQLAARDVRTTNDMRLPHISPNKIDLYNRKVKAKSFRQALEDSEEPLEHERNVRRTTLLQPLHSAAISTASLASTTTSKKIAWLLGSEAVCEEPSSYDVTSCPSRQSVRYPNSTAATASLESLTSDISYDGQTDQMDPIGTCTSPTSPSSLYHSEVAYGFEQDSASPLPSPAKVDELIERLIYSSSDSTPTMSPSLPALEFDNRSTWFSYSMASPPLSQQTFADESKDFINVETSPVLAEDAHADLYNISEDYSPQYASSPDVEHFSALDEHDSHSEGEWSDTSDSASCATLSPPRSPVLVPASLELSKPDHSKKLIEDEVSFHPDSPDLADDIEALDIRSFPASMPVEAQEIISTPVLAVAAAPVSSFKSRVLAAIDTHAAQLSKGKYSQPAIAQMETRLARPVSMPIVEANTSLVKEEVVVPVKDRSRVKSMYQAEAQSKEPLLDFDLVWNHFDSNRKFHTSQAQYEDEVHYQQAEPLEPFERPAYQKTPGGSTSSVASSQSSANLFTEPPSPAASSASSLSSLGQVEEPKTVKETVVSAQAALEAQYKLAAARDALKRVRHNVVTPKEVETLAMKNNMRHIANSRTVSEPDFQHTRRAAVTRTSSEGSTPYNSPNTSPRIGYEEEAKAPRTISRSSRNRHSSRADEDFIIPSRSNVPIGISAPKNLNLLAKGIPSVPVASMRKQKGKSVVYKPQTHITSINEVLS